MMTTIFIAIFAFIIAVGVLVTFHEFGHFWVARKMGVKVLRFSIGFGRRIFRWYDKKGTEYVIAAIPLGGYVKMLDEREDDVSEEDRPFAYNRKSVWARMSIILAGPVFNFIFAIFAYWLMFMVGLTGTIPVVGEVVPSSIAQKAGLQRGDQILTVDNVETRTWSSVFKQMMPRLGDTGYMRLDIKDESGQVKVVNLDLNNWEMHREKPNLLYSLGIEPYRTPTPPIVMDVLENEPAAKAGFLPDDEIIFAQGKPITRWGEFTEFITQNPNQPIEVIVKRQGGQQKIVFAPRPHKDDKGNIVGFAGLTVKIPDLPQSHKWVERFDPLHAMIEAVKKTGAFIAVSYKLIGKMIIGEVGLYNLSGPLTIAHGAGISFLVGFQQYINFLALISISLGVLNLLPIPVLDGGHLLYQIVEVFTGKPVSEKIQIFGYKLGLMFIIFLASIAFYNDLVRMM